MAPVALGCAFFDASAADARRDGIGGFAGSGESRRIETGEAAELGRAYLKGGDTVRALEMYRKVLAREPNHIDAMNGIAICYDRLGQFEVSRAYYEAALGMDPHSPMLLYNYGYSLFLQGDMDGAGRFLGLAAASEDPAVQNASLRLLARIDAAPVRAPAATAPQVAPSGPRIVRTSNHEQRLVLGGTPASRQLVASLGAETAALVAPLARLSEAEEAAIFAQEEQLVRAAAAQRLAALELPTSVPRDPVLPSEMPAARAASSLPPTGDGEAFAGFIHPSGQNSSSLQSQMPGHVLGDLAPVPSRRHHVAGRDLPMLATQPRGFPAQRAGSGPAPTKIEPAAEPLAKKRNFDAPFRSDFEELNAFAARLHGHPSAEQNDAAARLALLQDLAERTRPA